MLWNILFPSKLKILATLHFKRDLSYFSNYQSYYLKAYDYIPNISSYNSVTSWKKIQEKSIDLGVHDHGHAVNLMMLNQVNHYWTTQTVFLLTPHSAVDLAPAVLLNVLEDPLVKDPNLL